MTRHFVYPLWEPLGDRRRPSNLTIYGPCPVCDNWQLEAPSDVSNTEIEEIIREHNAEAHPGALDRLNG